VHAGRPHCRRSSIHFAIVQDQGKASLGRPTRTGVGVNSGSRGANSVTIAVRSRSTSPLLGAGQPDHQFIAESPDRVVESCRQPSDSASDEIGCWLRTSSSTRVALTWTSRWAISQHPTLEGFTADKNHGSYGFEQPSVVSCNDRGARNLYRSHRRPQRSNRCRGERSSR